MVAAIRHLQQDQVLKPLVDQLAYPQNLGEGDVYFALVRSIVSQQLSVKAAATIFERFLNLFEDGYPHIDQTLSFSIESLRQVGLSRQKASYIQNVADFFQEHQIHQTNWEQHSDDEVIQLLTQIKGVGTWTVQMIQMFSLNRPDVFPIGDLGIRQAMIQLYEVETSGKQLHKDLTEIAENWRPYRSIACKYLWNYKDK
jgi:DNA-3-methyladenine glycosylase II